MYINATLVAQIIHFFIAYWILRVFFFKPALHELEAEHNEKIHLEDTIHRAAQALAQKQLTREAQWREVQGFYAIHRPALDEHERFFFRDITPTLIAPQLRERDVQELIDQSSKELATKIRKIYHD